MPPPVSGQVRTRATASAASGASDRLGGGAGAAEIPVQRGLRDAGLGCDNPEGAALALEKARVFDFLGRVGEGPADVAVPGFGHSTGVSGTFGSEGAFHLGEQRQEQEGDAAHALVGGVDRQRVGQGPDADAALGKVMDEVEYLAEVAADPSRVCTTIVSPGRA